MIEGRAHARAGLLGNPSDGYFGKVIAVSLGDLSARVRVEESDRVEETPPIIQAATGQFREYCISRSLSLPERPFALSYGTDIPREVGLAGSSALITATLRALMRFFEVPIPDAHLPSLVLSVERKHLGIAGGLMDPVIQVMEGCVFMDFDRTLVESQGRGHYQPLDVRLLPRLFVAWRPDLAQDSGRPHTGLRRRYEEDDPEVRSSLERLAALAEEGRSALLEGDVPGLGRLMVENFELRCRVMDVSEGNRAMVESARRLGAPAKLTGSGGAIVGVLAGDDQLARLASELGAMGARVLEPAIAEREGHG